MISSVVSVPHKYHQLFLLNLGFMIAIAKGFSTISACLALLFIVLLATVVNNRLLPLICSNCHLSNKLFEDVLTEAEAVKSKVVTYLLHLQNECNNN